ncbi:MAG TPA: DNA polymerase III subunit alpha [Acidimicrobiales bacterium]|nr:DNA polymerase III subunit alpha [Acidimicrobiales bacterium]
MGASFTHLHQHTEYSMLDGAARIPDVIARAVADGQPAIGITDHGNMYGVLDFYKAARDAGIKPIIGTEAYMAGESRFERPVRRGRVDDTGGDADAGEKLYYHLTLLAENNQGYKNLLKLSSEAYLEGYFYKPRCLMPGQEIVTPDGVKNIEDIQVGDLVLSHEGRFRPVTQTMTRQHHGEIVGVRLGARYSRVTWMTGEHPVLIRDQSGQRSWVEARDIVAGRPGNTERADAWHSWVCLPKPRSERDEPEVIRTAEYINWEPVEGRPGWWRKEAPRKKIGPTAHYSQLLDEIPLSYEVGFFLGLYVAEGGASRNEVTWSFHRKELDLMGRCAAMVEKLTGKIPDIGGRPDRPDYEGCHVRVSSSPLAQLLVALCGKGARHKHLPGFVFDAPREFQEGIVEGVFAGDGAIRQDVTILCQTSRDLAWQIRTLRASLGDDFACVARVHLDHPAHADQYRCNFSPDRPTRHRKCLSDEQYVYKPVAAIETRHYEGPVYNIEVAEDHSYVSDFAIHNCDWELLERHHDGLIATTGCLGGVVLQALLKGDFERATTLGARLQDIFGKQSLFVELQDHGLPEQQKTNPELIRLARRIGAPLLATNDSHYVKRSDAEAHDALLCVQTGSVKDDPKRFKFHGDEHYLKTAAEMRSLFRDYQEACDNTLWIAERADVSIEFGKPKLPEFPRPQGFDDADSYLRHLTVEGAKARYGVPLPSEVTERLDYELSVISDMGFSDYFLVVWDLIRHAKEHDIRVGPGRGSAAGCCVAYCLRIVDLDPIRYDLLFERFLNPGRKQMPDIDMDFDERYRSEMIRYAAERYGWDRVAQIVTFSTIKARAAVRDAARVLGYPYGLGDKIAKLMPPLVMGRDTPLWACLDEHPKYSDGYKQAAELRELIALDPDANKVVQVARGLEGMRRQDGIHAAAVVISGDPLTDHLPIQRKPEPGGRPEDAPIVTQYEMHGVEELGLLKMDFLGLRNLSVIERTLDLIEASTGHRVDIDNIPLDDQQVYEMLQRGDSIGVFQLEGGPMRALMRALAPDCFDDVAALVALYRPGPMAANMHYDYADRKNGRKPITYLHPDLAEVLADTQGLMIFQESMMRVAQKMAGYSLEEADNLRKAAGKKIREVMAKEREKFIAGCERTGYGSQIGAQLFDIIEPFADYAFNKSHAFGYGFVSYQTAWLKAHYPAQYLAALLTSVKDDKDKTAVYLAECRVQNIEVLVPDINLAASDFTAVEVEEDGKKRWTIPFGLSAIRNVGEALVEKVIEEREKGGPFTDFYDFCARVDPMVLNKRTVESLIKAGAFDKMDHPRQGLCLVFDQIVDRTLARRREADQGVMSLFDEMGGGGEAVFDDARVPIPDQDFEKNARLAFEKEMLGLYLSDHPLKGVEAALARHTDTTIAELRDQAARETSDAAAEAPVAPRGRDAEMRCVGGVITSLVRKYTKRGDLMATFVLEDLDSSIEVWVFPRTMAEVGYLLADDAVVCVKGRLDLRDESPKFICMEIKKPELTVGGSEPLHLNLPIHALSDDRVDRLKKLLSEHAGDSPVFLHVGDKCIRLSPEFAVDTSRGLLAELRVLLGPGCLGSP